MDCYSHGIYAMGYVGKVRYDVTGLVDRLPLPVLVLVLVVLAIALFGMLSRIGNIFKGEGSALDFIGVLIVLVLFVLVVLIIGSGVVKGIGVL